MLSALASYDVVETASRGEEDKTQLYPKARPNKRGLQELARDMRTKLITLGRFSG